MNFEPSPEQREFIEREDVGLAVLAGAGSGKTSTVVAKLARLVERRPDAKFAAISFTERSAEDLGEKLRARLGADPGASGHWVSTIHGFCGAIVREFAPDGLDPEFDVLDELAADALWEEAVEALWRREPPPEVAAALDRMLARESATDLRQILGRLRRLRAFGALESLAHEEDPDGRALAVVGAWTIDRFDALKRRRGALDFDDLERFAARAVLDERVVRALRARYALIVVDEFQDTNPVQARIVRAIARPDFANLCVVGDPKQSIYRFRDADVSVFESFCAAMPARLTLSRNFRSRPRVLEYANAACARIFPSSGLRFDPLDPARPEEAPGREGAFRLDVGSPAELADFLRREVVEEGVPLGRFALLLRRIRGSEDWLEGLRAAGIPIAVGSGGLFWVDPRVREALAAVRWWRDPTQALAGLAFLRAPWTGLTDAEVDALWTDDRGPWVAFRASGHPIARAWRSLEGGAGGRRGVRPGQALLALLGDGEREREIGAAALGLWHRAEELSAAGRSADEVLDSLNDAARAERREREVPPPAGEGQLPVLTLHAAKGLEFDHVLLLDFGRKPRARPAPALYWDREMGARLGARLLDGSRDEEADGEWKARERAQEVAESKRLFYVAITRARERAILIHPRLPEPKSKPKAKKPPPGVAPEDVDFIEDHWRAWATAAHLPLIELPPVRTPTSSPSPSPETDPQTVPKPKRKPELIPAPSIPHRARWTVSELNRLARCPRLHAWTDLLRRRAGGFAARRGPAAGGGDFRELGTEVHACLETGDLGRLAELGEAAGPGARLNAAAIAAWYAQRESGGGADGVEVARELAFEVRVDEAVVVGALDRLEIPGEAAASPHRVLDYKIVARARGEGELLEAYGTQLDLYRWAVHALTGISADEVAAGIVEFSPQGARELWAADEPEGALAARVSELARLAAETARDPHSARATPNSGCAKCEHLATCPEGRQAVDDLAQK